MIQYSIYLDSYSNEYYVEIKNTQPKFTFDENELADNSSYRKDLIKRIGVLPFRNDKEKNELLLRLSDEYFNPDTFNNGLIQSLVDQYNDNLKSKSTYFIFNSHTERFDCVDSISNSLLMVYKGEENINFDILKEKIKSLKNKIYSVYLCSQCNHLFYTDKNSSIYCPKCKNELDYSSKKKVFSGSNAFSEALSYIKQEKIIDENKNKTNISIDSPFYYNGQTYGLSYVDFKSLHEMIYRASDYSAIMHIENEVVSFNTEYSNYLKNLYAFGVIKNKPFLNSFNNLMEALYGYLFENEIINLDKLIWDKRIFNSTKEFFEELVNDESLLSVFNDYTCRGFFNMRFDYRVLSMKVYEITGQFIYVNLDKKIINYGKYFFEELLKNNNEKVIIDKLEFIEFIKGYDSDYINLFKNEKYKRINNYYSTEEQPYPSIVDYYYQIFGEIHYNNIVFRNFNNVDSINNIIIDAYKSNRSDSKNYIDLIRLVKETSLMRNAYGSIKRGAFNYIDHISQLMVKNQAPSIELYLYCLNSVSSNTGIYYKRFDTLNNILKTIVNINNSNFDLELDEITKNKDVNYYIDLILKNKEEKEYIFPDSEKNDFIKIFNEKILAQAKENSENRKVNKV